MAHKKRPIFTKGNDLYQNKHLFINMGSAIGFVVNYTFSEDDS